MPLFSPKSKIRQGGQLVDFICPRCREPLRSGPAHSKGAGVGKRRVEGIYTCSCGYQIECIETFPTISGEIVDEPVEAREE